MSASLDRRGALTALREADASHDSPDCPAACYTFVEFIGEAAIRCVGCGDIIWRA